MESVKIENTEKSVDEADNKKKNWETMDIMIQQLKVQG